MASIADLKDFRQEGPPADIGTFQATSSVIVFQFTFSGTTRIVSMSVGVGGWVLIDQGADAATVINNSIATLPNGGEIFVLRGIYIITITITLNNPNLTLKGEGARTILQLSDGNDGGVDINNPFFIVYITADRCLVEELQVDGNAANQTGGYQVGIGAQTADYCKVINCWLIDIYQGAGVQINDSDYFIASENICDNCGHNGIESWDKCVHIIFNNNIVMNSGEGLEFHDSTDFSAMVGNSIYNIGAYGIAIDNADGVGIVVVGNTINTTNTKSGIYARAHDIIIVGNFVKNTTWHGIDLVSAGTTTSGRIVVSGNRVDSPDSDGSNSYDGIHMECSAGRPGYDYIISDNIVNNVEAYNVRDGIRLEANISNSVITNNHIRGYDIGINIVAVTCADNLVIKNYFVGNTTNFNDGGTDTRLETIPIPLIQGTTFISTAGEAWGWEIDADTEFALGIGWLPLEVQQVVRIRVIGVALAAPGAGDYMRIQITGEGATFDEVFTTEPIDVVDHNNEEANVAIDDVINWVFTATDDADIGHLLGGDRLQIKVLHEGVGNGDAATNAIVDSIQIEYV